SLRAQPPLFAPERGIVGERQEPLQQRRRIAGVVDASPRRRIRKFGPRDEIALAHLDHVDTELARAQLDEALVDSPRVAPSRGRRRRARCWYRCPVPANEGWASCRGR